MENIQDKQNQATADQFWKTYFSAFVDQDIDENVALEIDFWNTLTTALQSVDRNVIQAVIVSKILLHIANADMHLKIIKMAKHTWDMKQHQN
jgi:hypothetical protein